MMQKQNILIESYAGNSMHNTTYLFEDLFSTGFEGDIERSYQLFATIYKQNNKIIASKKEKIYETLRNKANGTDAIALLIPVIIYEAGPEETTQNFINNVLEKNYQKAIDSYINDSLNNNTEYKSSYIKGQNDKIDGYGGDQNISALILSIVSHGYATFDTDKVTSEKWKKIWKEDLENNNNVSSGVSPEKAEEWFKIFDIK